METSETTCRICSDEEENNVLIFGEEGIKLNIQLKIRKYLYFNVSSEDDLPKIVCINCCKKLNAIHRFAMKALKIQSQFREQFYRSVESDVKANNGLLHSYLLQGKNEQYDQDITEMEVKVDPSLFLQCIVDENEDISSDYDEDSQLEMDDCASHVVSNRIFSNETSSFSEDIKKIPPDTQITLTDSCPNKNFNSKKTHNSEPLVLSSTIKTSTDADVIIKPKSNIKNEQLVNITKDLLCLICQLKFSNECELQNHLFFHSKSDSDKTYSDNDFLSTFDMLNMLKIDTTNSGLLTKENADEITVSCPICKKNNFTKTNLKIHIEIHRPKGRHACNICGRIFKTEINLLRHKEYHDGIQFPCNVCGRVYPTKSTLRAHSITHSDLRPHKCTLCNKTFKRNQDLKFHLNQHTGARPYQCLYCPKAFASSGNCFSHRKRMHSNEVERDRERIAEYVK